MPSRNLYSLIPVDDFKPHRQLNVEDAQDEEIIRMIVQLCRVILRALEITALRDLQSRLNDMSRGGRPAEEIEVLTRDVAQLLGSLRWRLAWWQKIDTNYNHLEYTRRTTNLTEILYFWYFTAFKKLPDSSLEKIPQSQEAMYADVGIVVDELPTLENRDGFRMWLLRAHQIIHESQMAGLVPEYEDYSNVTSHQRMSRR